ncbi:MAG: DUF58 domain-containing protein [Pseudomonadota bacterium]
MSRSGLIDRVAGVGRAWARRRQGLDRDTVRLERRRIYILPTKQGAAFGAMVALMLVGSMNYNNSIGLVITFSLGAFGLVVMHHCHRSLNGLILELGEPEPVFAGQDARFPVRLMNDARHARLDLGVFVGRSLVDIVSLGAGEQRDIHIALPAPRRGTQKLERFAVRCRYPAGLFQTWAWLNTDLSCLVYPSPAEQTSPPPNTTPTDGHGQNAESGQEDFAGLRDYRPGDPARRIAWKAYARTNALAVKTFSGSSTAPIELRLADTKGALERRLSILTRWCLDAHALGRPFALALSDTTTETGDGRVHLNQCLRQLALYG